MKKLLLIILLLGFSNECFAEENIIETYPKCEDGWYYHHQNKDFAVYLYCGDAQGSHIAILKTDETTYHENYSYNPQNANLFKWPENIKKTFGDKVWLLKEKLPNNIENYWDYKEDWSNNIKNFAWSPDGKYLYVSTIEIYGTGNLYLLDLYNKKYYEISPSNKSKNISVLGSSIKKVFDDGVLVKFSDTDSYDGFCIEKRIKIQNIIDNK